MLISNIAAKYNAFKLNKLLHPKEDNALKFPAIETSVRVFTF